MVAGDDMIFIRQNAKATLKAPFPDVQRDLPLLRKGVPLKTDDGPGTAGPDWDEATLKNELLTSYIDDDNYVSGMTDAALEDPSYCTVFDTTHPVAAAIQLDDLLV